VKDIISVTVLLFGGGGGEGGVENSPLFGFFSQTPKFCKTHQEKKSEKIKNRKNYA